MTDKNAYQGTFDKFKDGYNKVQDNFENAKDFYKENIQNNGTNYPSEFATNHSDMQVLNQSNLNLQKDNKFLQTSLIDQKQEFTVDKKKTFLKLIQNSNKALGM